MTAQQNNTTAEGIAPRTIIGGLPLVENARLIEVTTINRKIADQLVMRAIRTGDTLEGFEILGRLMSQGLIVVRGEGKLWTLHESDFLKWQLEVNKGNSEIGYLALQAIPQLFTA